MADYKVKWIVKDKRLIKFHDNDASYPIVEGVEFDKVENGSDVEAEINGNGVTAISVKVVKEEEKPIEKVEEKKETTPVTKEQEKTDVVQKEVVVEEKTVVNKEEEKIVPLTWTISALAFEKGVVKFEEQTTEKYWYPIASGAKNVFKVLRKGDKVQVVIDKMDATTKAGEVYQKDGVAQAKSVVKKEEIEPKKDDNIKKYKDIGKDTDKVETNKASSSISLTTNESIERQVAVKGAIELVQVTGGTKDEVAMLLKFYTKVCFEAMQEA